MMETGFIGVVAAGFAALGVTSGLIRVSVGLEHWSDLRRDMLHALGG